MVVNPNTLLFPIEAKVRYIGYCFIRHRCHEGAVVRHQGSFVYVDFKDGKGPFLCYAEELENV